MIVTPFVGFDNISFGMKRAEAKSILGLECFSFRKTSSSENLTDMYQNKSISLFYDIDDTYEIKDSGIGCYPHSDGYVLSVYLYRAGYFD